MDILFWNTRLLIVQVPLPPPLFVIMFSVVHDGHIVCAKDLVICYHQSEFLSYIHFFKKLGAVLYHSLGNTLMDWT